MVRGTHPTLATPIPASECADPRFDGGANPDSKPVACQKPVVPVSVTRSGANLPGQWGRQDRFVRMAESFLIRLQRFHAGLNNEVALQCTSAKSLKGPACP